MTLASDFIAQAPMCLYRKDAQGNICALIDSNGNVVVEYKYDAWGNHAALYRNKVNDKEQYSDVDEAEFDENYAKNKAPEFIIRGLV